MKITGKKRVCIIGNNASGQPISDGGRIKIRLYRDLLLKEGVDAYILDLDGWFKHILRICFQIKKAIKNNETILIMAGPSGSRKIIPLVNAFNGKKRSRVVYCPLGIGTIEKPIRRLPKEDVNIFINGETFFDISDDKIGRGLSKLDCILAQNEVICNCYKKFYGLSNVIVLNNFRYTGFKKKEYLKEGPLSLVFLSRVCEEKGIFDLIDAVKKLNEKGRSFRLDIYGDLQFQDAQEKRFRALLDANVRYLGIAKKEGVIETIGKYDLFVLPTKYIGEGTSGALIEAFLSGTPALVSSYSQAKTLIEDGHDGFIFKLGDKEDLAEKLLYLSKNRSILKNVGVAAQQKAVIYTYEYNRPIFLSGILGDSE